MVSTFLIRNKKSQPHLSIISCKNNKYVIMKSDKILPFAKFFLFLAAFIARLAFNQYKNLWWNVLESIKILCLVPRFPTINSTKRIFKINRICWKWRLVTNQYVYVDISSNVNWYSFFPNGQKIVIHSILKLLKKQRIRVR